MRVRKLSVLVVGAICAAALALPGVASAAFGPLGSFAGFGEEAGQFEDSGGLAVGPDGRIYQADYGGNRVNVFAADGAFLFAFGSNVSELGSVCTLEIPCRKGFEGSGAGALDSPEDVAVDKLGRVFVADTDNNRISLFAADGEFLAAFGKGVNDSDGSDICDATDGCLKGAETGEAGALNRPQGLDIEDVFVYVADTNNNRVAAYNLGGQFLGAFGWEVDPSGGYTCSAVSGCQAGDDGSAAKELNSPTDLAFMPGELLAVADSGNRRIDVFDQELGFERGLGAGVNASNGGGICTEVSGCQAGSGGAGAGALGEGVHLAYDNAGGVYVGDVGLERVSQFNLASGFVRAFGAGVLNGAAEFQVCTTICAEGLPLTIAGATPNPYGVAVAADGSVLVAEEGSGMGNTLARIERFGFIPDPPAPPGPPVAPSNNFKFGKLKLNKKAGSATLTINVPGAGSAVLKGNGIKKVKKAARKAGKLNLPVKLTGKAKKKLLEKGKSAVSAKITFTPSGGKALTKQKRLTLKKKL